MPTFTPPSGEDMALWLRPLVTGSTPPPRVTGLGFATRTGFDWEDTTGATSFDVVKGSLATLRNTAGSDLRARRMAGRGPAHDRRFFELVLAARDSLPSGTRGIALYAPEIPEWGGRYLAIYELAPIPVVAQPERVPAGWVALVYGSEWPQEWRVLRALPGGALLAP